MQVGNDTPAFQRQQVNISDVFDVSPPAKRARQRIFRSAGGGRYMSPVAVAVAIE